MCVGWKDGGTLRDRRGDGVSSSSGAGAARLASSSRNRRHWADAEAEAFARSGQGLLPSIDPILSRRWEQGNSKRACCWDHIGLKAPVSLRPGPWHEACSSRHAVGFPSSADIPKTNWSRLQDLIQPLLQPYNKDHGIHCFWGSPVSFTVIQSIWKKGVALPVPLQAAAWLHKELKEGFPVAHLKHSWARNLHSHK